MFDASPHPSRTPETAPAYAASSTPVRPSQGPRRVAPVARPSSGKYISQLPPYPTARPVVSRAISSSATRVETASRFARSKARKVT